MSQLTSGFTGRRVMITAAASGIGRTIAERFHAAGARVFVCDVDEDAIADLGRAVPDIGSAVADVSDSGQIDTWFDLALAELGGLDVLVNNAGVAGPAGPIEALSPTDWARTIDVNLNGVFHCVRRAVPVLKGQRGGAIVNIASTAGLHGYPLRTPYAASKWAVVGLTKSLAMELGEHGVRVNAICPGSVDGDRIERVIAAESAARGVDPGEVREAFLRQVSMRTFVTRNDVADLVLFVCSDAAAKVSGQALAVDGHTESLTS